MSKYLTVSFNNRALIFKYTRHQHHEDGLMIKYKIISPFFKGLHVTFTNWGTCKQLAGEKLPYDLIQIIGHKLNQKRRLFPNDRKYTSLYVDNVPLGFKESIIVNR